VPVNVYSETPQHRETGQLSSSGIRREFKPSGRHRRMQPERKASVPNSLQPPSAPKLNKIWVLDNAALSCAKCNTVFTFFNRRVPRLTHGFPAPLPSLWPNLLWFFPGKLI